MCGHFADIDDIAGFLQECLRESLAHGLPEVAVEASSKVHQESDRKQHPTSVALWTVLTQQTQQRFQQEDVQVFNPAFSSR